MHFATLPAAADGTRITSPGFLGRRSSFSLPACDRARFAKPHWRFAKESSMCAHAVRRRAATRAVRETSPHGGRRHPSPSWAREDSSTAPWWRGRAPSCSGRRRAPAWSARGGSPNGASPSGAAGANLWFEWATRHRVRPAGPGRRHGQRVGAGRRALPTAGYEDAQGAPLQAITSEPAWWHSRKPAPPRASGPRRRHGPRVRAPCRALLISLRAGTCRGRHGPAVPCPPC